ncbi:MAG: Ig-like domain-containing protein [Treponemataceae bacterium]
MKNVNILVAALVALTFFSCSFDEKKAEGIEFVGGQEVEVDLAQTKEYQIRMARAVDGVVNYKSENTDIADVDPLTGLVTFKGKGSVVINAYRAMSSITSHLQSSLLIHAIDRSSSEGGSNPSEEKVILNKTIMSLVLGTSYQLQAEVLPSTANQKVEWKTSNKNFADVTADGSVIALGLGDVTITAMSENGESRCAITVVSNPISVSSIKIKQSELLLGRGKTKQLDVVFTPPNATNQNVMWVSDDDAVAVDTKTGLITAVSGGSVVITAISEDGAKESRCLVTVPLTDVPVESVKLDKSKASVPRNKTIKLIETVLPPDAVNTGVTWKPEDDKIASVQDGIVTGKEVGETKIFVITDENNKIAECIITVLEPVDTIIVKDIPKYVVTGSKFQLNHQIQPTNVIDQTVEWSSSNTNIATIDHQTNSVLVGNIPGHTTIKAIAYDGKESEEYTVYVKKPLEQLYFTEKKRELKVGDEIDLRPLTVAEPADAFHDDIVWQVTLGSTSVKEIEPGYFKILESQSKSIRIKVESRAAKLNDRFEINIISE